jgi:DNA polymerase-3 subunit epsilon
VSLRGLRRWWRSLASVPPFEVPELVSLDLETSSLDPKSAEILSIAAVPVRGRQVVLSERFERIVRAGAAVDREAVKYHRLLPEDTALGVPPQQAAREFAEWLGERPLLGYCIGFDCAMLEKAALWAGGDLLDGPRFDIRDIFRRRMLDGIIAALDLPRVGRHTALGDATAVGIAFLALKYSVVGTVPRRKPR